MVFVIIEYLTLDGWFKKVYGHYFMLVNPFRHGIRINLPFYLRQSLGNSMLAFQNNPDGDHVFHEGLMVLIMNLLNSKTVDRPRKSKKIAIDYEMEGSDSEEDFDKDTKEEVDEVDIKQSMKGDFGSVSKENKKQKGSELDQDSDYEEEMRKGSQKRGIGREVLGNRGNDVDRVFVPSDDEPLIQMVERKRKLVSAQDEGDENVPKEVELVKNKQGE